MAKDVLTRFIMCTTVCDYLLQEVALKVHEVVGLDDVGAALTAEHPGEQRLHGWGTRPRAHHGIGDLQEGGRERFRSIPDAGLHSASREIGSFSIFDRRHIQAT